MSDKRTMHGTKELLRALDDMLRYQAAYKRLHGEDIEIKWKRGWYLVGDSHSLVRRDKLVRMAYSLEKKAA